MTNLTIEDVLSEFPGSRIAPDNFDPVEHCRQFLRPLYGNCPGYWLGQFFEIRLIRSDGRVEQCFYESPEEFLLNDCQQILELQNSKKDFSVYFGICPRNKKQGRNENVSFVPALWADVDRENAKDILSFKPSPDIIVDSGFGRHGYWILKSPAPANEMTQKILRSIQKAVGSDTVSDFSRVMRLPGSLNLKDPAKPKRCKTIYFKGGEKWV